jgi:putative ABC transport system permease protein
MEIVPILATLRRNKTGALLVGLQLALALVIVCTTLSVIHHHLQEMLRPSGLDETNIFTFRNEWIGQPDDLAARIFADLAIMRSVQGVVDAAATQGFPLCDCRTSGGGLSSDAARRNMYGAPTYYVDDHGLAAFGLRLTEGRWFRADEIGRRAINEVNSPSTIVVTRALGAALYPHTDPLGQLVYGAGQNPARIIGVIDHAQNAVGGDDPGNPFGESASFVPIQYINNGLFYLVRSRPGQQDAVMKAVQQKLYELTPSRVIEDLHPFSETRTYRYRAQRASTLMLGGMSVLLMFVTASGIVGLTMYWVLQRRRHIGMRRALGARRADILRYFHTENLLIAGAGAALGTGLCLAVNLWLATRWEMKTISPLLVCGGAAIVMALSQAAVLWPALRAAATSPASAIRNL